VSAEGEFASLVETMGIDVFWNGQGRISIRQQENGGLVEFTDDEAGLLLQGLARALGYRVVKQKAKEGEQR